MVRESSFSRMSLAAVLLCWLLAVFLQPVAAQTAPPEAPEPKQESQAGGDEKARKDSDEAKAKSKAKSRSKGARKRQARRDERGFYMGRPIADVMSWEGVDWLFRETRIEEEQPEAMLDALKIPKGATVADVGAGAGYHSIRLARRVGPMGVVLASDLQPEMLMMLQRNARQARVTNIKPIRATQLDTKLPEGAVDLILMVDVYHECTSPEITLKGLRSALKPKGRLVLVEFRGEDDNVPIKPEHKMTLKQVRREVEPQGFTFKESLEFLPWQHVIIFEKQEAASNRGEPGKKSSEETAKQKSAERSEESAKDRPE
jgi:ubiquinone/menaquinone biosynthesis C-methylase UbiE